MKFLFTACIFLLSFGCYAQAGLSAIPAKGDSLADFVPTGYSVLDYVSGDLNKDGKEDIIAVLRERIEEADTVIRDYTDNNRLFIVLFALDKGYTLAAKSDKLTICKSCGGWGFDAFHPESLTIDSGNIVLNQFGGGVHKWQLVRIFRYMDGGFYLISATDERYINTAMCDEGFAGTDKTETDFLEKIQYRYTISEDCKSVEDKYKKIRVKRLTKLEDINLRSYTW